MVYGLAMGSGHGEISTVYLLEVVGKALFQSRETDLDMVRSSSSSLGAIQGCSIVRIVIVKGKVLVVCKLAGLGLDS